MTTLLLTHDADGQVVDWRYVPQDDYVPAALDEVAADDTVVNHRETDQWMVAEGAVVARPQLAISGDTSLINDGTDEAAIDIELTADDRIPLDAPVTATLLVDDSEFELSLSPGEAVTETITSTAPAGETVTVEATADWPVRAADPHTITVTNS